MNGDGVLTAEEFMAARQLPLLRPGESETVRSFRNFLLESEEAGPLWYRVTDSSLTALGTLCFVTSVVQPQISNTYHLPELEDFINVSFLIKFVLLAWINNFDTQWIFSGKGALDLASCLPVLEIPARYYGGPPLARTANLLQIGRFLRLLREALPSDSTSPRRVPLGQQILAVILSLLGTIVVAATVLFSFENPNFQTESAERSFEDALIYMVNVFAGRDPPWYPEKPQAKIASVVATICAIIFVPFLISRTVELFMTPFAQDRKMLTMAPDAPDTCDNWCLSDWVSVMQRLDALSDDGILSKQESRVLRKLCLRKNDMLRMLVLCYGEAESTELYAARLRELAADCCGESPEGKESGASA